MSKPNNQRLTNGLRDDILHSVTTSLFNKRRDEAREAEGKLAEKLLVWYIEPKNAALMKQLPDEYFYSASSIRYQEPPVSGKRVEQGQISASSSTYRVPASLMYGHIELPLTHGLWKEIRAVQAEQKAIHEDSVALRDTVRGLLYGVTTIKALVVAWPEVEEYLPKVEETVKSLPAIRAEELNGMIAKLRK